MWQGLTACVLLITLQCLVQRQCRAHFPVALEDIPQASLEILQEVLRRDWQPILAVLAGCIAYGVLALLLPSGALLGSLLLGSLLTVLLERYQGYPLAAAGLAVGLLPVSVPLVWLEGEPRKIGLCTAVLLLAAVWGLVRQNSGELDWSNCRTGEYLLVGSLPLLTWLPLLFVLAGLWMQGCALSAAGDAVLLLTAAGTALVLLVLLLLQRLLCRCILQEARSREMARWQGDTRDYMNQIRSQRHDLNLHLNAISGMVAAGRYEDCRYYVNRLVAEAGDVNQIMPLADVVVGAMVYNMREEARKKGSDIHLRITYDMADTLCSGFACNRIIGNLLQNAIDALESPEDLAAGIKLSIFKRRGNTVVLCENRFTGDRDAIARAFEPGFSTKRRHEGIGLATVQQTVRRCGGRIYPEFGEDAVRFVVNLPNRVNLERDEEVQP